MTSERKFIKEKIRRVLLKESIKKEIERAGFGGMEIRRTPHGTRIVLTVERPGLVIGRKGMTIKKLTADVEEKFHYDNPQIEVGDSENPNVNAQIMAQKLASALERGWHFRRAGHSTVRRIMEGGAKGCMIIISGKLTGQRHRTEKFSRGHIKYCGDTALKWMDVGFAVAKKKLGAIGVKVMIMDSNARLPDEVEIKDPDPEEEEELILLVPKEADGEEGEEEALVEDTEGAVVEMIMAAEEDDKAKESGKKAVKKEKSKTEKKEKSKTEKKEKGKAEKKEKGKAEKKEKSKAEKKEKGKAEKKEKGKAEKKEKSKVEKKEKSKVEKKEKGKETKKKKKATAKDKESKVKPKSSSKNKKDKEAKEEKESVKAGEKKDDLSVDPAETTEATSKEESGQ